MHHNRVGDQLGFNYIFRQLEAEGRVEFLPEEYNYRPGIAVSKLQFKHGLPITRHQKPIYVPHSTGCRKLPDKIRWNASEGIKQKPSNLKIDVITPAYKATETFVTRYLQSIAKQTIEPDNVLIGIDNCEQTRRNLQKAKPFTNQVKTFWFPEHCGPYLIRNTLAEISDADVLLFFDIDDEMMPQYVARLGICCSSGTVLVPCSQWIKNGKVIRKNHSSYCQFGIKRQDFLVLNGFEPWECHADYEFQVRAKQHGIKWHKLNTVLFNQYKHNNNLTVREDTKLGSNKRNYYDSIVEERKKHPITKQTLETTEYELAKSNKTNNQSNKFIRQRDHELDRKLIVSLTSFPPRFKTLPLSLDCLLSQTIRPDKVILWIAEKDTSKLTHSIEHREGLEIKSVPGNIKSYKKIIPALKKYPDAYIVTADDDLYYPPQWLENMVCPLKEHGDQYVYAHRVHRIQLKNGEPKPYRQWKNEITETGHHPLNFSTNGAGTLFPPGALNADVLDESLFMSLCPHADDLWLYWQLRRQKTQVYKVLSSFELAFLPGSQKGSLKYRNVFDGGNDRQIQNLINYYGFPSEE
jgi:glycosyltransferase involved in cell wall biosynthesis